MGAWDLAIEDIKEVDAPEDMEQEPDEKANYTDRHPEHFQDPPGHVSEIREGEGEDTKGG